MNRKSIIILIDGLLFFSCIVLRPEAQEPKLVPRQLLIQDARQIAQILDLTHADPHIRGGGNIAFHGRLQEIIRRMGVAKVGVREQNLYGSAREEDMVTVDYEMAERALEWLEYINTGADEQSIRQFFLERVASTKGCQAIIHHWARFRKWDEEEFFRFIMEALGRIPVELAEKGDRRAVASLERRMKFWEYALANPARIKRVLEDMKKTDLKKATVALARRYLPDDAVVRNDFYFVLFGASTAFSVGKENGFDLLQLPKTKDGRLDVDQIVLTLAHELHHSGFSECVERNTPRIQEDERIMLLGILAAEGMPTYFINKPFEYLA